MVGCRFVGISANNEVFIELDYDDLEMQNGAALRIKREFSYVPKVNVVIRPSVEEAAQMVEDLNSSLDTMSPKTEELLNIKGL